MNEYPVILFDGVCNFCNRSVNFIIKRDKKKTIRFSPLQSDTGRKLIAQFNLRLTGIESFVFIEKGKAYIRSTAALMVCRHLKALWPLCFGLIIVPKFIRDGIYNWFAGNRYKWFGARDQCMIPTPEIKAKFLN